MPLLAMLLCAVEDEPQRCRVASAVLGGAGFPPSEASSAPSLPWSYTRPTATARSRAAHGRLCARAYHSAIALTLATPRTSTHTRPRPRANALTHSAVAARSL